MQVLMRAVIGVLGALGLLVGLRMWTNPNAAAAQLGLSALKPLGYATLRADLAGFFLTAGGFALAAAIRNDRRLVTTPFALVALAFAGRCLTVFRDGLSQPMIAPMAVEAVLLIALFLGRRGLSVTSG